jgi:SAM-dependent methyltransferase
LSFILVIRLIRKQRKWIILLSLFSAVTGILLVHNYSRHFAWSPYYKIQVNSLSGNPGIAYRLSVNDDYHQFILNLDPRFTAHYEDLEKWRKSYDFPFSLKTLPDKCDILVLGAGTGNDVAAALRNCDCRIDSVELDPMILKIGKNRHPEKPYTNERVRIFTADARAFLTAAKKKYDIIVFGWLDSHRLFSSLSNVRQDNFVYTVEAMKKARHALKKDGLLVLSFYVGADWIGGKIFGMLKEAFSWEPGVYAMAKGGYGPDGQIFVIGNNRDFEMPPPPEGFLDLTPRYQGQQRFSLPTDDWPYLYYKSRHISWEYLLTIFILFAISTLILLPSLRSSEILWQEAVQFFLLGVAFLLLEVRNITTLALVFGSTWLVSSIVIAMVLVMILGANALVARKLVPKNPAFMWGGLIVSIILGFFWNRIGTISSSHTLNALLATFVVSLTFFFAGIIFAYAFSGTKAPGVSLGFNILGAVFGGLLEYACLLVGIGGLSWIALFIYLAAWIFFNSTVRLKK